MQPTPSRSPKSPYVFLLASFQKAAPTFWTLFKLFSKSVWTLFKSVWTLFARFSKAFKLKVALFKVMQLLFHQSNYQLLSSINTNSIELQNAYFESIFVNRDKKLHSSKVPALFPKMGKMGCLNLHSFGLESTMMVNLGSWRELVVYYWSMKLEWIDSDRPRSYTITKSRLWKSVWTLFKKRLNAFQKRFENNLKSVQKVGKSGRGFSKAGKKKHVRILWRSTGCGLHGYRRGRG